MNKLSATSKTSSGRRRAAPPSSITPSQTSWLLFLKYLDGLEQDRATEARLDGKKYAFILDKPYRWESWAAPKDKSGKLDHNTALSGDDLRDFVNAELFPYLHKFKQRASGPNTIEYKIGEIFGEIKNKITSGYNLREIIEHIDELRFRSQAEKHEPSHLYEAKVRNMGATVAIWMNCARLGFPFLPVRSRDGLLGRSTVSLPIPSASKASTGKVSRHWTH